MIKRIPRAKRQKTQTHESFARLELQTCLTDGLFMTQSKKRIDPNTRTYRLIKKTIDYKNPASGAVIPDAIELTFEVPEDLTEGTETVFLTLLKLAGQKGDLFEPTEELPETSLGIARVLEHHKIKLSKWKLLSECRLGDRECDYDRLTEHLRRLARVRVEYRNKATGKEGIEPLLFYTRDSETGEVEITINWRLSGAITGVYLSAPVDLEERHQLTLGAAKILHRWLSGYIWSGRQGYLLYATLCHHTWPEEAATPASARRRLSDLRQKILPQIASLPGWRIDPGSDGVKIRHR